MCFNLMESQKSILLPHASEKMRLFVLAVAIGLLAGLSAALLKWIIGNLAQIIGSMAEDGGLNWNLLWVPIAGIVLTGIYQRYILHRDISHGVERVAADLAQHRYDLSPKLTYAPVVASSITLGFGGSAGAEGPIATVGAAIGSNIGRKCGLSDEQIYMLIACGAGAGIAGIFKAPVGGALFSIEVMCMSMTTMSVMALLASCITAALTAYILSGCTLDISWTHNVPFDISTMPWFLALGLFCGLYSLYYSRIMTVMRGTYSRIVNPWAKNILSGAVLALSLFLFPSLYGEGYGIMHDIINGDAASALSSPVLTAIGLHGHYMPIIVLGALLLVKCFACSASNSGGGVAGDFAPTLFAGCMAGLLFATVFNMASSVHFDTGVFAVIGMAGVMAGVIRAPLMALFITAEMCNSFDYFLPLTAVVLVSYGIVKIKSRFDNMRQ